MKPLKLLSMSILIASALLLSAARSEALNSHPKRKQSGAKAENRQSEGAPVATPIYRRHSDVPAEHGASETYNYNGTFNYVTPSAPQSFWTEHSAAIAGTTAILLTFFTGTLVYLGRQAARAAASSAEAAGLALNAERPYVFVENERLVATPLGPFFQFLTKARGPEIHLLFQCDLVNRGKGVALLEAIHIRAIIRPLRAPEVRTLTVARDPFHRPRTKVVGPDKNVSHRAEGLQIPESLWAAINSHEVILLIVGSVTYRDVFRRKHSTKFCFGYDPEIPSPEPNNPPLMRARLTPAADRLNRYT